ncbi:acyltransferase family protein [Rhodopirellula sp. MGV]|uniref:acyltransferase family protein n=1 Tax=Rhodopirellula sp. MGV TaxID=2023130 RepID=UPI000B970E43|nr:acyltransferase family protein [Rhodopirellula sp. MGV]OYP35432.1 hypothetical protein CGZ80_11330 [Rhodopirellula sp. MGV]PNY33872.1 acyltransferase [Rhodopirellula baltica]
MSEAGKVLMTKESRYRPEIDGLRAIAVLSVVIYHAGLGLSGGFVGVDVFFVISGYLVTGIIRRQILAQSFSLRQFYCRRIRRIFPAAAVVTAVVLAFGYRSVMSVDLTQIAKASLAQSFFVSNAFFWSESGYFSRDVMTKPMLHFWSLAIEEQFYLFFPLVLVVLAKLPSRFVRHVIAFVTVLSFLLAFYGTYRHTSATFYLLPTRAWELLAGGWLAFRPRDVDETAARTSTSPLKSMAMSSEILSAAGLMAIVWSVFWIDESIAFPGWVAVVPVFGAVAVIATNERRQTWAGRLLSIRPVVFVGLISYSLYLWHWPLMAMARYFVVDPSRSLLLVIALLSLPIAALSWRLIEQPFRKRQWLASDKRLVITCTCVWGFILFVSMGLVWSGGATGRFGPEMETLITDATWTGNWASREIDEVKRGDVPEYGVKGALPADVLLWGDSHAMTWINVIDQAAKATGRTGVACLHGGTPPITGLTRTGMPGCDQFNAATLELAAKLNVKDIFLVSRWSVYVEGYSASDPKTDGRRDDDLFLSDDGSPNETGAESLAAMIRQVQAMGERLQSTFSVTPPRVWLIRQIPPQHSVVAVAAVRNKLLGWPANEIRTTTRDEYFEQQKRIESFYEAADAAFSPTGGGVIDFNDQFFDSEGRALIRSGEIFFYRDDDHLSRSGADRLKSQLVQCLGGEQAAEMSQFAESNAIIAE